MLRGYADLDEQTIFVRFKIGPKGKASKCACGIWAALVRRTGVSDDYLDLVFSAAKFVEASAFLLLFCAKNAVTQFFLINLTDESQAPFGCGSDNGRSLLVPRLLRFVAKRDEVINLVNRVNVLESRVVGYEIYRIERSSTRADAICRQAVPLLRRFDRR